MNPMPVLRKLDEVRLAAELKNQKEATEQANAAPRPSPIRKIAK